MRADENLLFHLVFLHLVLQHLHLHDVDRSLVGVYMGFHLHVVPFMALERLRIFDRPGLLIFVCDKRDLVTFCLNRTCDALKRSLGSLIFLGRFLGGWILCECRHAEDDGESENDQTQLSHWSTSLQAHTAFSGNSVVAQSCSWNAGGELTLTNMLLLHGGSQVAGASGIQRRAGRVWVTIYIVLRYDGRHFVALENSMIKA